MKRLQAFKYELMPNGGQDLSGLRSCVGGESPDASEIRLCGFEENADVVGAINVLARGHRVAACGETAQSDRSMKQEPTEAI